MTHISDLVVMEFTRLHLGHGLYDLSIGRAVQVMTALSFRSSTQTSTCGPQEIQSLLICVCECTTSVSCEWQGL